MDLLQRLITYPSVFQMYQGLLFLIGCVLKWGFQRDGLFVFIVNLTLFYHELNKLLPLLISQTNI